MKTISHGNASLMDDLGVFQGERHSHYLGHVPHFRILFARSSREQSVNKRTPISPTKNSTDTRTESAHRLAFDHSMHISCFQAHPQAAILQRRIDGSSYASERAVPNASCQQAKKVSARMKTHSKDLLVTIRPNLTARGVFVCFSVSVSPVFVCV